MRQSKSETHALTSDSEVSCELRVKSLSEFLLMPSK